VASLAYSGIKMRQTIKHLREGWYGNLSLFQESQGEAVSINNYEIQPKDPVDCNKLFRKSIKMANEKFIPMCEGITGCIGSLLIDRDHIPNQTGMPIDMLIVDLTRFNNEEENEIITSIL
jgi:hypothetical protein